MVRRVAAWLLWVLLLSLPLAPLARAEELDASQLEALQTLRQRLETIDDLAARERIDAGFAERERAYYLGQAAAITSTVQTPADLRELCARHAPPDSALGRLWGWFTFVHAVWLIVAVLLTVALGWLATLYLVPLVVRIPRPVLEAALYAACAGAVAAPRHCLSGGGVLALAVTGCLGLLPLVAWTATLHFPRAGKRTFQALATALGLAWGAAALLHESSLLATGSLLILAAVTGTLVVPWLDAVAFLEERAVPAVLLVSLLVLVAFAGLAVSGQRLAGLETAVEVYRPGALWLGTLAYFSACLTLCSRHYEARPLRFALHQLFVLGSGALALAVGSVFQLDELRESGGSFFAFYLGTKFFDLPWKRAGWAWGCLAGALLLWGAATFMERYPAYFLGF